MKVNARSIRFRGPPVVEVFNVTDGLRHENKCTCAITILDVGLREHLMNNQTFNSI